MEPNQPIQGGNTMKQHSHWEKCRIKCPEEKVDAELLVEWREQDGKLVPNSISCNNPKLMDLKPVDCKWTCWEVEKDREN
jgi:hypothetical protein